MLGKARLSNTNLTWLLSSCFTKRCPRYVFNIQLSGILPLSQTKLAIRNTHHFYIILDTPVITSFLNILKRLLITFPDLPRSTRICARFYSERKGLHLHLGQGEFKRVGCHLAHPIIISDVIESSRIYFESTLPLVMFPKGPITEKVIHK